MVTAGRAGPDNETGLWDTIRMLADVVEGIAVMQDELVDAVVSLQREQVQLAGLDPLEQEVEATEPEMGLCAQAHRSHVQSGRLIQRAKDLAARAEQLTQQAETIVGEPRRRARPPA